MMALAQQPIVYRTARGDTRPTTELLIVLGLSAGPAVALGFARFAYALLLPAMRSDLGWSFAAAGAMNAANAVGYLMGALLATRADGCFGLRTIFVSGLALTAVTVTASGLTDSFGLLIALRAGAGLTGALTFVAGGSLAAAAAVGVPRHAPTLLGIYFGGAGIGIATSALVVPSLIAAHGWPDGWIVLGCLAFVATGVGLAAARGAPMPAQRSAVSTGEGWSARFMAIQLIAYALFGAGYIAYATFIIAYLRTAEGFSDPQVSLFWTLLGVAAVAGAFAWGPVLARLKGGWGVAVTIWTTAIGAVIPLVALGHLAAFGSALVFGFSFLAVIAAVTTFARRAAAPHAWTAAIAALTTAFGSGQAVGPVLGGALSDHAGGLTAGLWLSTGVLLLAGAVATFQAEPEDRA